MRPPVPDVLDRRTQRRALAHLRRSDPVLAAVVERVGPLPPRLRRRATLFGMLGRAIVYQQISRAAAAAIHARLVALCGGRGLRPAPIRSASDAALRAAGLSRQKHLGICKSMQLAYGLRERPGPERMRRLAEPWRPWRTVACFYLWRALDTRPPAG